MACAENSTFNKPLEVCWWDSCVISERDGTLAGSYLLESISMKTWPHWTKAILPQIRQQSTTLFLWLVLNFSVCPEYLPLTWIGFYDGLVKASYCLSLRAQGFGSWRGGTGIQSHSGGVNHVKAQCSSIIHICARPYTHQLKSLKDVVTLESVQGTAWMLHISRKQLIRWHPTLPEVLKHYGEWPVIAPVLHTSIFGSHVQC